MTNPTQNLLHSCKNNSFSNYWAIDHDNRYLKNSCSINFCSHTIATRVFRYYFTNLIIKQYLFVIFIFKWTLCINHMTNRLKNLQWIFFNESKQIKMLILSHKLTNILFANGKKYSFRGFIQRINSLINILYSYPVIFRTRNPLWSFQSCETSTRYFCRFNCVLTDIFGKWVSGIDQVRYPLLSYKVHHTSNSAKTAYSTRKRLCLNGCNSPSIRDDRTNISSIYLQTKFTSLFGSSQYKNICHG